MSNSLACLSQLEWACDSERAHRERLSKDSDGNLRSPFNGYEEHARKNKIRIVSFRAIHWHHGRCRNFNGPTRNLAAIDSQLSVREHLIVCVSRGILVVNVCLAEKYSVDVSFVITSLTSWFWLAAASVRVIIICSSCSIDVHFTCRGRDEKIVKARALMALIPGLGSRMADDVLVL